MANNNLLTVSDFARISRVSLAMLHHYDKINLLSPAMRAENGYRYYSLRQLSEINLIRTMQDLGMSLAEIKELKRARTPERTAQTLTEQLERIEQKIAEWSCSKKLTAALLESIVSAQGVDETSASVQRLPEARIVLGDTYRYGKDDEGYDALASFFRTITDSYPDVDLNRPVWGVFSEPNVRRKAAGEQTYPERYFFYSDEGRERRPAGLYAVGYSRGGYGEHTDLYARMAAYITATGYEIAGDAYEEYPLNEICIADEHDYLARVLISVSKKSTV